MIIRLGKRVNIDIPCKHLGYSGITPRQNLVFGAGSGDHESQSLGPPIIPATLAAM